MNRLPRGARVLLLGCAGLVLALLAAELGVRLLGGPLGLDLEALARCRGFLLTGQMGEYEPRAYTVFQRPRGGGWNAFGFQDGAWTCARTSGVPRILCLGGSTTEGGNPHDRRGSYPFLLERTLEARTGRDIEVMNAGISGWTSAEMLCSWFLTLADFAPDVLVLHEGVNDLEPRFRADFEPDYSHWRHPARTSPVRGLERTLVRWSELYVLLELRTNDLADIRALTTEPVREYEPLMSEGKLPHETSLPFRRNIESIARDATARGVRVVLMTVPASATRSPGAFWDFGLAENNQHLRELAAAGGWLLADAARHFEEHPELAEGFVDYVHLGASGNRAKADLVADTLAPWLAQLSPADARPPAER